MPESRSDYTPEEERLLEADLHQWLTRYIDDAVSLHALHFWLTQRSWQVNPQNKQLWGLYATTRTRIQDFDDGGWTQDQLRASLAHYLRFFRDGLTEPPDPMSSPDNRYVSIKTWQSRPPSALLKDDLD